YPMKTLTIIALFLSHGLYSQTVVELVATGKTKIEAEDYKGAIADLDKAVGIDPKRADSYLQRGIAKYYSDDTKAMTDFNKAIELDSKLALAYHYRGNLK